MPLYKNVNLYIIFFNTLVAILSVSLIVPTLPIIGREFSLTPAGIGMIITSYTLPGVVFVLVFGVLADRFGRKVLMVPSLILFGLAGGAIYWVHDFFWMNVLRLLQGIGGAILPSMSTLLIGDLFDEKIRLKVMGLNAAVLSVGTAFFPLIGGTLAEISWNTPFLVFTLAIPLAICVALFLEEPQRKKNSGNMMAYFREARVYLISPRSLFVFAIGTAIFILLYGGILTYLTLYMDNRFNMSAFDVGLYISVGSIATAGLAAIAHKLEQRIGRRFLMVLGFSLFSVAFFSIPLVEQRQWLMASIMIFGGAMGATIPLLQSVITEIPPIEYRGLLVSMLGMVIRLGQTLGPPLLAVALYLGGMQYVFIACGIFSMLFVVALFFFGSVLARK